MGQLSAQAAALLHADTARANANVSLLHIFDQSSAPGGVVRFKTVLAQIEGRLNLAPLFRQRLQRLPGAGLGLDRPHWVADPQFDLEYHVRHIALPKPGDWRQFCIQVARIHSRALDLERPLWEAYVIEGLDSFLDLPSGSFALLFKTHLAAVGLSQLGALSALLCDDPAGGQGAGTAWLADAAPAGTGRLTRGLLKAAGTPLRLLGLARPLAGMAARLAPAAMALANEALLRPGNLPATRFNAVVSPHRVFETRRFAEAEFAAICGLVKGARIDDAVLAVCGGALRRYLGANAELPAEHSLVAVVSSAGSVDAAWRAMPLGTDIADPVKRLAMLAAFAAARGAERGADAAAAAAAPGATVGDGASAASAAVLAWARRAGFPSALWAPPANCSLSAITLLDPPAAAARQRSLCGARLTYFSAVLPISDGLGLAFAVSRCDGRIVVSPTSCRELLPDPEVFAQCLRDSFQEFLALAQDRPVRVRAKPLAAALAPAARRRAGPGVKSARPGASATGRPRRARPLA